MILQFLLFSLVLLINPLFPRVFTPIEYSMGSVFLVQNVNPRILSGVFVGISTLAAIILRFAEWYIIKKFQEYQRKHHHRDLISRRSKKFTSHLEPKNTKKRRSKFKDSLAADQNQGTLFVLAILGFAPTIPDIVTVALLQKRLKLWYFIIAAILWKCIQFLPFVFLGKWILAYFNI